MYELTEQTRTRFLGRIFFPDNWAGFPCCVVRFSGWPGFFLASG